MRDISNKNATSALIEGLKESKYETIAINYATEGWSFPVCLMKLCAAAGIYKSMYNESSSEDESMDETNITSSRRVYKNIQYP